MTYFKILFLGVVMLFGKSVAGYTQELRSGYFLGGYQYRHLMNPALSSETPFFSMPMMGNIAVGTNGNVGVSDFLYKYDDPLNESVLTTFLHRSVSSDEFLKKLDSRNRVSAEVGMNLFTYGFKAWGGFHTIGVGLHSRSRMHAPYELFDFMKSSELGGNGPKEYRIENFRFDSENYLDISWNHARTINDRLTVGGTFKLLVGAAYMETRFDEMQIRMGEDEWLIHANGTVNVSAKGSSFGCKPDGEIEALNFGNPGVGGLGAAIDLGAAYRLTDGLSVSVGVLDLGAIGWFRALKGATGNEEYPFKGFEVIGVGSDSAFPSLEEQLDGLGADFEEMAKMYDQGYGTKVSALTTKLNIGVEYALEGYRALSFGLLSSTYIHPLYRETEMRASVNVTPTQWFGATVSGAWSTYGPGWGMMLNFRPKRFNFFIGTDFMLTEVTPQFVPVNNLNVNFCTGINFLLGKI